MEFHFISSDYHDNSDTGYDSLAAGIYEAAPYEFLNKSEDEAHSTQNSQIIRQMPAGADPETLEMISNPPNKNNSYFYGWYTVDVEPEGTSGATSGVSRNAEGKITSIRYAWAQNPVYIPYETPITVTYNSADNTVTWTVDGGTPQTTLADETGCAHVYLAPMYDEYHFVNFHLGTVSDAQLKNSLLVRKLAVFNAQGEATVRIGDIHAPSPDARRLVFSGWETASGDEYETLDSEAVEKKNPATSDGYYITLNENTLTGDLDLYPFFVEARWITYSTGKSGNGAKYVGSFYRLTNDLGHGTYYTTLPTTERNGFEFQGWYLSEDGDKNGTGIRIADQDGNLAVQDAAGNDVTIDAEHPYVVSDGSGQKLYEIVKQDDAYRLYLYEAINAANGVTFYAKWHEVEDTSFHVIVWKQKVDNDVDAWTQPEYEAWVAREKTAHPELSDADFLSYINSEVESRGIKLKTYDYVKADSSSTPIPANSTWDLDRLRTEGRLTEYESHDYAGFDYSYSRMSSETVAGDKSTVVNVYYDREVHTLTFQVQDYTYTATTSNTGTQYGFVDGLGYVQLTRNGNNGPYFQYTPVSSPDTEKTYYVLYYRTYYPVKYSADYGDWIVYKQWYYDASVFGPLLERANYTGTRYTRSSSQSWQIISSITALYEQDISEQFPIIGNRGISYAGYYWHSPNNNPYTLLMVMPTMPDGNYTLQGEPSGTSRVILYYKEVLPGEDGERTFEDFVSGEEKSFALFSCVEHAYQPLTFNEDFFPIIGFTNNRYNAAPTTFENTFGSGNYRAELGKGGTFNGKTYDNINYLYYTRNSYTLTFNVNYPEGVGVKFLDAAGNQVDWDDPEAVKSGDENGIFKTETVKFGASLSSFRNYGKSGEDALIAPQFYTFGGWYKDKTCTEAFDFSDTMPSGDVAVYAKWTPVTFRVHIDPNGAEIDHIDHTGADYIGTYGGVTYDVSGSVFRPTPDAEYVKNTQSTYINVNYMETVKEYTLAREYVPISDAQAKEMQTWLEDNANEAAWLAANPGKSPADYQNEVAAHTVYYYFSTDYQSNDGTGLPSALRNALYLTQAEVDGIGSDHMGSYWRFYKDWYDKNLELAQASFGEPSVAYSLGWDGWKSTYLEKGTDGQPQKYRKLTDSDSLSYTFLGWYRVYNAGQPNEYLSSMPYNFSDPVTKEEENMTLRAVWRLDGVYKVKYHPDYTTAGGAALNGSMEKWYDPDESTNTGYADGAETHAFKQPDKIYLGTTETDEYIFRGWYFVSVSGTDQNPVYTALERDSHNNIIYYNPGEVINIQAKFADLNNLIHLRAYYEAKDASYRRPEIANLTLHPNAHATLTNGAGGTAENASLPWSHAGTVSLNADQQKIEFGDIQSNAAVAIADYKKYFNHEYHYRLLGFDKNANPDAIVNDGTGAAQPFVPNYSTDSTISVQRTDDEELYAIWEPMVYLNLKNETGVNSVFVDLSNTTDPDAPLRVTNLVDGEFGREPVSTSNIEIPVGGEVTLAIPYGAWKEVTVSGTNTLGPGYILHAGTSIVATDEELVEFAGHGRSGNKEMEPAENNKEFSLTDRLVEHEKGITVTFTQTRHDYTLVLDDNYEGGTTQEYYFSADELATASRELPSNRTRLGYSLMGWALSQTATVPDYVSGAELNSLTDFFGTDIVKTLYGVWEVRAEANTVLVYKDVPAPGNQDQRFTYTVSLAGTFSYSGGGHTSEYLSGSGTVELSSGEHFLMVTVEETGSDSGRAYLETDIKVYLANGNEDTSRARTIKTTGPKYDGKGTFSSSEQISVTETEDSRYQCSAVVARYKDYAITAEGNAVTWKNPYAGGTVIFTNTRKTADVTVEKILSNETGASEPFSFSASYSLTENVNGTSVTTTRDYGSFTVNSGEAGHVLDKVPVGAVVTITENLGAQSENYITTADHAPTSAAATTSTGGLIGLTYTLNVNDTAGVTVEYTNILKSFPVRIVKVDQDGVDQKVQAKFDLYSDSTMYLSSKWTTDSSNLIYESDHLYVGAYTLEETDVQDGYLKLSAPVTITVDGTGIHVSDPNVTSSTSGGVTVLSVKNRKTVTVQLGVSLEDTVVSSRTFAFSASYQLGENIIPIEEDFPLTGYPGSEVFHSLSVPVGAVLIVKENDYYSSYSTYETQTAWNSGEFVNGTTFFSASAITNEGGTVRFKNIRKTADIAVTKTLVDAVEPGKTFTFMAALFKTDGTTPITYGDFTEGASGNEKSFTLGDGASRQLTVPSGATVAITETDVNTDVYTLGKTAGTKGTLEAASNRITLNNATDGDTVGFTNTRNQFTVNYQIGAHGHFTDSYLSTISHENVDYGTATPVAPGITANEGYYFTGWSPVRAATVTEAASYTAQYEEKTELQLIATDVEFPYDGSEHSGNNYVQTGTLKSGHALCGVSYTIPSGMNAGTYYGCFNGDITVVDTNNGDWDVTEQYTIRCVPGKLQINKISATVAIVGANNTTAYDGDAHTVTGYTATANTALYDVNNDFTFSGTATAARTDAGTTNMGLAANQFTNTNPNFATVTFNVTDGYQTITPIDVTVTITGHNNTATYDGTELSVSGYDVEISNPLYTEADFTFSGTATAARTDVGTTNMGLAANQFSNTNPNFETVTFNVTDGYQTITPVDVTVTITGHNNTTIYVGTEHSVSGYDVEISNPLYTEADFTFSGTATAARTDVGTTNMGLAANQFSNTNPNFETVTFNVTDGYQTINPKPITVTRTLTVPYTGEEQTLEINLEDPDVVVDGLVDGDTLKLTGAAVSGTNIGTYNVDAGYTWSVTKTDSTDNTGNYTITVNGKLIIQRSKFKIEAYYYDDGWHEDARKIAAGDLQVPDGDSSYTAIELGAAFAAENADLSAAISDGDLVLLFAYVNDVKGTIDTIHSDSPERQWTYSNLGGAADQAYAPDQVIRLYYTSPLCKVTDNEADNHLLYRKDSTEAGDIYIPAIYSTIRKAFGDLEYLYLRDSGETTGFAAFPHDQPYMIQMLTDYEVPETDVVEVPAGHTMTFTTADTSAADGYSFRRSGNYSGEGADDLPVQESVGRAVLRRTSGSTKAFFTVSSINSDKKTTFNMKDLIIDGAGANLEDNVRGGALTAYKSDVTIENCVIYRFEADQGGAVYTTGDNLTVKGTTFDTCKSMLQGNGNGGGAINTTATTLTMTGTDFINCSAIHQGGAIYHYGTGRTLNLTNCEFTDCTSRSGGAVEADVSIVNVDHCKFVRCKSAKLNNDGGNGGGLNIHFDTPPNGSIATIQNTQFLGCSGNGLGGGLRSQAKTNVVTDCSFLDDLSDPEKPIHNEALDGGGAAFTDAGNKTAITGCTFQNCVATRNGGGVYNTGSMSMKTTTIGGTVAGCTAASGGGVYVQGSITLLSGVSVTGNHLSDTDVTKAAGIYIKNGSSLILGADTIETLESVTVTGNTTSDNKPSNLRLSQDSSGFNSTNSVKVMSNLSTDSTKGCSFGVVNPVDRLAQFGTSTEKKAGIAFQTGSDPANAPIKADTGGLYGVYKDGSNTQIIWYGGTVICRITNSSGALLKLGDVPAVFTTLQGAFGAFKQLFTKYVSSADGDNIAYYIEMLVPEHELPGQVSVSASGVTLRTAPKTDVNIDPSILDEFKFQGEYATCRIYQTGATLPMFDLGSGADLTCEDIVFGGTASTSTTGGVLKVNKGATLTMSTDAKIQYVNVGYNNGAGIYVNGGSFTLESGAEIQNCNAYKGGAIFITGNTGAASIKGGTIHDNTAGFSSAAIRIEGEAKVSISGGEIIRNFCSGQWGGAIAINYGTLTVSGGKIKDNGFNCNGEVNGGAIFVGQNGGKLVMTGGEITDNTAISTGNNARGGAIYIQGNGEVELSGGAIHGNTVETTASGKVATGAGICIGAENGSLKISGNPQFGTGNFGPAVASKATNGGEAYPNGRARQDIYIAGFKDETPADSLHVAGTLTGDPSVDSDAIWVWAEKLPHYRKAQQFAVIDSGVSPGSLAVFRDARTDEDTTETVKLNGKQSEENSSYVVWDIVSGMEVFFKKTDGFGDPLAGARFSLYDTYEHAESAGETGRVPVTVAIGASTSNADYAESTGTFLLAADGATAYNVTFKVPSGVYYMKENAPENYKPNNYVYRVVVGTAGSWVEGVKLPDGKEFLIQRMSNATTAETVPNIAASGIRNESSAEQSKVILRKTASDGSSLAGAKFQILRYDRTLVSSTDEHGDTTTTFISLSSGVYFIDELPFGTYYIHETVVPEGYQKLDDGTNWFVLTVNADGVNVTSRLSEAP